MISTRGAWARLLREDELEVTDDRIAREQLDGDLIAELDAENKRLRAALEHLGAADMWMQVEGCVSGPDLPDGEQDPLIWRGADDPMDIARAALQAKEKP